LKRAIRISLQRLVPLLDAIKPHSHGHFKSFYTASTPRISDAPASKIQNHFMLGARSLHAVEELRSPPRMQARTVNAD
jgi:hypothetical protein